MRNNKRSIESVIFEDAGTTRDGKHLYKPEQSFQIPPVPTVKGHGSRGELNIRHDEFFVDRPAEARPTPPARFLSRAENPSR